MIELPSDAGATNRSSVAGSNHSGGSYGSTVNGPTESTIPSPDTAYGLRICAQTPTSVPASTPSAASGTGTTTVLLSKAPISSPPATGYSSSGPASRSPVSQSYVSTTV